MSKAEDQTPRELIIEERITHASKAIPRLQDTILTKIAENIDLRDCVWNNVGAKKIEIKSANFSYGLLEDCYFHNVTFLDCNFTGCRFIRCNLPTSSFVRCDLQYANFEKTQVERTSILQNKPERPNVARELFRNLRTNAIGIGNRDDANAYIDAEIKANSEFLRRAVFNLEPYYERKYPFWPHKPKLLIKYAFNWVSRLFWGHGESFWKLVFTSITICLFISTSDWLTNGTLKQADRPYINDLIEHIGHGFDAWLNLGISGGGHLSSWASVILTLLRYVSLGLAFSILYRRNSYR